MLLLKFMMTQDDLPGSKFVTAVLVPVKDLRKPVFQYSHEYEECSDSVTLSYIMNQGGVCLVFEDYRDAFSECVVATPTAFDLIHDMMLQNELNGSYSEIVYRLKNPTILSQFMLDEHNIFPWSKELPAFVQAKKRQMERRRDWSHWDQDGLESHIKSDFAAMGLDYTDFAVLQSPSSGVDALGHDFSSGYSLSLRCQESGFLSTILSGGLVTEHNQDSIRSIFSCLFGCTQVGYKSPHRPYRTELKLAMAPPTTQWPNGMGVLTTPKERRPGMFRLIRPRSDMSLFWGCEIVFLAAVDSYNTDSRRLLALAAFWARLVNRTLQTTECCLPIFWVSDQSGTLNCWAGECYLVYENNTCIYYHRLEYTPPQSDCQLPNFPLTDAHSRAHFHLRLLNAADPCHRQLNSSQQTAMETLWRKLSTAAVIQDEDAKRKDGHVTRKQKRDRSIDLPEFSSSFELEKTERHGIYFIRLNTGQRCIRKIIGKSGREELNVYRRLQEHRNSPISGINHFILEWSTGSWSLGEYLQLPRLIPVSREMKDVKSCFGKQALSLCKQLLDGINFLHSQLEVAHMDMKPDNMVLDLSHNNNSPMFTLKIIDFNISITDVNCMVAGVHGTKGYTAPEVEENSQYWPFLADQYSCGACIEVFLEHGHEGF